MTRSRGIRTYMNRNLSSDLIELYEENPSASYTLDQLAERVRSTPISVRQSLYNLRKTGALPVRGEYVYRLRRTTR